MGKNKKEPEKAPTKANESQQLGHKRNMPMGSDNRGGQSPK